MAQLALPYTLSLVPHLAGVCEDGIRPSRCGQFLHVDLLQAKPYPHFKPFRKERDNSHL
jgi:hypothetical protein